MSILSTPSLPLDATGIPAAPARPRRTNVGDRNFFAVVTGGVLFVPLLVFTFMAVVVTMTDLAASGPMFKVILAFLIVGAAALKWLRDPVRLWVIIGGAIPVLYLSAALVAGGNTVRLPITLFGLACATAGGVF